MQRLPDREPGQDVAEAGEPRPTRLDLHGQVFGVLIRIHPLFWPAAAALGWGAYANPDQGSFALLLLWALCVIVSLLIHELAHVAVARMFGGRLGIVLWGLGSWTTGMASLSRAQRVVVRLAGPLAQASLLGLLWLLTGDQAPAWLRDHPWAIQLVMNGLYQLGLINLAWLVLNLLPLWPLDGGYLLRDLCEAIFGARGTAVALGVCMGVPVVLASWIAQQAQLPLLYDPRGGVQVQMCGILLIFCVLLFLSAFRALREDYREWRAQETAGRQSGGDVSR